MVEWQTLTDEGRTKEERLTAFGQSHLIPDTPEVPECAAHVWQWFSELSTQRHTGPEALSWAELKAWAELTGSQPTPEEIRMLVAIDCAYIMAVRKQQKEQAEKYRQQSKK